MKYKIKKSELYNELKSLRDDEGPRFGWGRFIEGPKPLIDFFNEYCAIEHENFSGSCYAIGAYSDVTDCYWDYDKNKEYYANEFNELIQNAISNTGMYEYFGNKF